MAAVLPAAPINAFPVVIAGPTGPPGPPAALTELKVEIEALKARLAALEELAHVR